MFYPVILAVKAAVPAALSMQALNQPAKIDPFSIPVLMPESKLLGWATQAPAALSISDSTWYRASQHLAAMLVRGLIDGLRLASMTAVFAVGGFATSAHAEQAPVNDGKSTPTLLAGPFSPGTEVEIETLSNLRGGSELVAVSNAQKLGGTVADNAATNIVTGANSITTGAFANVSGIPIVIQNSGANVLIQNATIINLQLQ